MKSFYEYKKFGLVFVMGMLIFSLAGCTGTGNGTNTTNNKFSVVVFSDVHFNPFYDSTLFSKLVAADADQWAGIFQTSKITAPSEWGADTNYPLLALALSSIFIPATFSGMIFRKRFSNFMEAKTLQAMQTLRRWKHLPSIRLPFLWVR
jgi:hypothetical protein